MNTISGAFVPTFNAAPSQPPATSAAAPTPIVDLADIRRQMDEVKTRLDVNDRSMHRAEGLRNFGFGTFVAGAASVLAGAVAMTFAPSVSWGLLLGGTAAIAVGAPTTLIQSRKAMDANFACLENALELYKLSAIEQLVTQAQPPSQP